MLVVLGDSRFLTSETLIRARRRCRSMPALRRRVRGGGPYRLRTPLVERDGSVIAIREEKEATAEERKVRLCNSGVIGFRGERMLEILTASRNDNAKGEYYLTDAIEIGRSKGVRSCLVTAAEEETLGINDRAQLAAAERIFQDRARASSMAEGVTMIAPETVYVSHDTRIGRM